MEHDARPRYPVRQARHRVAALVLFAAALSGCAEGWRLRDTSFPRSDETAENDDLAKDAGTPATRETPDGDDPLAQDAWARQVKRGQAESDAGWRWRHVGLESVDGELLLDESELNAALRHDDKLVATNARLLRLRHRSAPLGLEDAQWLAAVVTDRGLSERLRAAAVETLAVRLSAVARDELKSLLANQAALPVEARVELLQRGATWFDPALEPAFVAALGDDSAEARTAAVEAFADAASNQPPARLADMMHDSDPGVRAATVRALARGPRSTALEAARAGLRDSQLPVRLASIDALGDIADPQASELLRIAVRDEGNQIRAAAVDSLARHGDKEAVFAAAQDKDPAVRAAAARALRVIPARDARPAATALIADRSMAVRRAAIESITAWPLADAAPLLFTALEDRALDTRQAAHDGLTRLWSPAGQFRPTADRETRETMLDSLRQAFNQSQRVPTVALGESSPSARPREAVTLTDDQLDALVGALEDAVAENDAAAIALLRETDGVFERQLVAWAERHGRGIPDILVREVLAPRNETLRQLETWDALTLQDRRQLAGSIARRAADQPLTPLAVRRLVELVQTADDPLLWQSGLDACQHVACSDARRFAAAALSHPRPEVRRRGCQFFFAQPGADAVQWLSPALADETSYVAAAAARAIGRCGRPPDLAPLAALCGHADPDCRVAAAEVLAGWGDDRGHAALERLAYDGDPAIRIRAAEAMGRVGAREFTPTLLAMLTDDLGVRRAALASLPAVTGEELFPSVQPAPSMAEQVARWKRWADQSQ